MSPASSVRILYHLARHGYTDRVSTWAGRPSTITVSIRSCLPPVHNALAVPPCATGRCFTKGYYYKLANLPTLHAGRSFIAADLRSVDGSVLAHGGRYSDGPENASTAVLPSGPKCWFVFNSTECVAGGTTAVRNDLALDEFPVYVRAGSLAPLQPWDRVVQHSEAQGGPLEMQVGLLVGPPCAAGWSVGWFSVGRAVLDSVGGGFCEVHW